MKRIVMAALLSTCVVAPAVAADTGFYAGIKLGYNIINEGTRASGVFGGYVIGPDFAVELGYTDLGSMNAGSLAFSTLELGAVATFPINQQVTLFGKLGLANTSVSGSGLPEVRRITATYGMGGQFNIMPNIVVRFGWDNYKLGDGVNRVRGNSNLFSVASLFKF